ncbi:winged helix-turn-helix domain-containing protein [Marinicella sp. S1101]|uniref:winged helix-turn-helix domain-containing protein n=1 Tax=Marinicella marina TaxID=2996016 RepID=UPI002260DD83|nr:winged helix-turn-helix domain-containing protein [Marinicella marina]MCX7552558.1 winged helix-turn-helix domain-containing protein [Marinicella marina]MDJ1139434.1 winged helix-turn-helix domain-containing protein [Marinicella marina]
MTGDSKTTTYSFLDFKFTPSQHQFTYRNQVIQLSKKNHVLLLALIQSNGDVIEKDNLIAQVWPNQIVTDSALNKQITRLRKLLADYDDFQFIETIRGVGIRFTCELHIETVNNDPIDKSNQYTAWVVASIVFALVLVLWQLNKSQNKKQIDWQSTDTINMAIIPSFTNNDWLNVGGLNYLSNRLLDYREIQTIQPKNSWFEQSDQDVFAIELSQMPGIEYVLMVENQTQGNQYIANLLLRNQQQIVAKNSLKAATVSLLLKQIETWTLQQLNISVEVINNRQQEQPTATDFVMESYLRGLAAAKSRSYDKAKLLLNTAVEQDPDFFPAWITLADVETELGQFEKALGLINTLISSGKLNDEKRLNLAPIQVKNLIYLNRLDEAQTILDESMQQAEVSHNINVIMYNMNNQLVLNDYKGIDDKSDVILGQKLLALTEKFDPSPDVIGVRQHNLAVSLNEASMEPQAIEMIQLAIKNFKLSNNSEGLLSSYRVWSDVHAYLAQFSEAQLALEKAKPYLNQVEGARTLVNFWSAYGWVHYELGDLSATQKSLDALNQLSIEYASLQPKVTAFILEADMSIAHGLFEHARTTVDSLLEITMPNPEDYPVDAPYAIALDLYLNAVMLPTAQSKEKKAQYLNAYPTLSESIDNELMAIDSHILFKEGFIQQAIEKLMALEDTYMATRDISFANNINKVIIGLMINDLTNPFNRNTVRDALDRIENRDRFVYPFNKFKAQWLAHEDQMIQAVTLMSELKTQAKDFWKAKDQLLLEKWQAKISQVK